VVVTHYKKEEEKKGHSVKLLD